MSEQFARAKRARAFWLRVSEILPSGCQEWLLKPGKDGYGRIKVEGVDIQAHRVAWMLANQQSIPDGFVVMHRCDNPLCCRPDHLWVGTQAENIADRVKKGRSARGRAPAINAAKPSGGNFGPTTSVRTPRSPRSTSEILTDLFRKKSVSRQSLKQG